MEIFRRENVVCGNILLNKYLVGKHLTNDINLWGNIFPRKCFLGKHFTEEILCLERFVQGNTLLENI